MPVEIHGKEYQTVAERLSKAHADKKLLSVETEVLNHDPIVIRAKIDMGGQVFTGISSVAKDSIKQIEKANPYEVAETSAVGRALAFAGYGGVDSIASADEIVKSEASIPTKNTEWIDDIGTINCPKHPQREMEKQQNGKLGHTWDKDGEVLTCYGKGFELA